MEFFDAVYLRQSVRKYKETQISDKDLDAILLAGCAAPVGMAAFKGVKLAVIQDKAFLERIDAAGKAAMAGNGPNLGPDFSLFYNSPTLIVAFAEPGRILGIEYANVACVLENVCLAATALGLGSVYLFMVNTAFASDPALAKELGIPDEFKAISAVAIGEPQNDLVKRDLGLRIEVIRK